MTAQGPLAPEEPKRSVSVINRIVAASLRQRFLVLLAMFLLIGVGIWSLNRLPVEAYPDLSPPMVEIVTQWPGHAAEEVERLITVPVEVEMNGIPNMVRCSPRAKTSKKIWCFFTMVNCRRPSTCRLNNI